MQPQFTDSVANALNWGFNFAKEHQHTTLNEIHLQAGLLQEVDGYFSNLLEALSISSQNLLKKLSRKLEGESQYSGDAKDPVTSPALQKLISTAETAAKQWGDTYICSDHILYALAELKSIENLTSVAPSLIAKRFL